MNAKWRMHAAVITLAVCLVSGPATAQEEVIIASTGGAYDRALKEAWFDPFTKETGIQVKIVSATNAEMRAKASAMVKAGNVSWDLYLEGEIQAASDAHRQVTEDLTEFCSRYSSDQALATNACQPGGALLQSTATLLAFRKVENMAQEPSCLIPDFDGALFSHEWRDALWAKFFTAAPRRQRRSVERYNIVKRA